MYEETKAELVASGNYNTKRLIRFTYGNTHKEVDYPQARDGSGKSNEWIMNLSINDGKENVGKYIQSVTYILHPTYANSVIKVIQAPFTIRRLAWGYFDVTMKIKFFPKYGQEDVELVHNLRFAGGGLKKSVLLKVDDLEKFKKPNQTINTAELQADKAMVEEIVKFIKSKKGKDVDNNV